MLRLTDTHCHLNLNNFQQDLEIVLERSREAGVYRILVPGVDIQTSQIAVEIAEKYSEVYASIGIHPTDAGSWTPQTQSLLRDLAGHQKVVAIGEIGLDYYHQETAHGLQKEVLVAQLSLASEVGLPVVLHNRESFQDLWEIISSWQEGLQTVNPALFERPGVFHSFDGTLAEAQTVAKNGFFVGISGPITYKNAADRRTIASTLPIENLLLETDAPFLTPVPRRGRRNEPAYTLFTGKKLAECRGLEIEEITGITADNAARLFMWEP